MNNKTINKPKMVLFTNWLNEDFIGKWAGVEESFKPGQSKYVEDWKGSHYAKHLVDQYFNSIGKPTSDFTREKFRKKCFGEKIEASAKSNIEAEIYNKNKELETKPIEQPKPNPKPKPEKEDKPKEKEFQDLKDGNN